MRHGIAGNKLGRNAGLRKATIRDIARATLVEERVCTTLAKAKEARKLVDRLITLGKKGTLSHKRKAFSILTDHEVVSNLFNKTSPRFNNRMGGYTRIIPLSNRKGDNAQLAYLELTEKEKLIISKSKSEAKSKAEEVKSGAAAVTEKKKAPGAEVKPAPHTHEIKEPKGLKQDPAKMHPVKKLQPKKRPIRL